MTITANDDKRKRMRKVNKLKERRAADPEIRKSFFVGTRIQIIVVISLNYKYEIFMGAKTSKCR